MPFGIVQSSDNPFLDLQKTGQYYLTATLTSTCGIGRYAGRY